MEKKQTSVDAAIDATDSNKRETLKRMATMAFVAPIVASFGMEAMSVGSAGAVVIDPNNIGDPQNPSDS